MSKQIRLLLLVLAVLASLVLSVNAQEITPREGDEINPDANISWPLPVYVLRGAVEIRGSANLPNMTNYFLEFRPLVLLTPEQIAAGETEERDDAPWFPATLPSVTQVSDGILGTWDTETAPDGVYEMRLVLNVRGEDPTYFYVSPLRVENMPPDFVVVAPAVPATATAPVDRPTLAPTPTVVDTTPRVTARLNANVRSGDSQLYPVIGTLNANTSAVITAISSTGSGWYQITQPSGVSGWIAPSVVDVTGNTAGLPRIAPPPPPATPTPAATLTPLPTLTPISSVDLVGDAFAPSINPPVCNQPFDVFVNLANRGTTPAAAGFTVIIRDVHVATGTEAARIERRVDRALAVGENFVVGGPLNVSVFFNEQHRIEVLIDTLSQVPESNETNNTVTFFYTLQRGGC